MSRLSCLVGLCAGLCLVGTASAQTEDITREVDETIATAQQTQQQLDDWSQERDALEARYRAAQVNIFYLKDRLEVADARVQSLDGKVAELARRLTESGRLQAVITDTLRTVFARLEQAVQADQPFLAAERRQRLESLRHLLAQTDVTPAEKLRRLLEALLVEAKYGETVEVTQESIDLDGQPVFVDMLRIGRLSLFWQTPDKERTGTYDPVSQRFVALPDDERRDITQAMEMASNMRPVELLPLPLGRIAP